MASAIARSVASTYTCGPCWRLYAFYQGAIGCQGQLARLINTRVAPGIHKVHANLTETFEEEQNLHFSSSQALHITNPFECCCKSLQKLGCYMNSVFSQHMLYAIVYSG